MDNSFILFRISMSDPIRLRNNFINPIRSEMYIFVPKSERIRSDRICTPLIESVPVLRTRRLECLHPPHTPTHPQSLQPWLFDLNNVKLINEVNINKYVYFYSDMTTCLTARKFGNCTPEISKI